MIEPIIRTILINDPTVAALVADRIYLGAGNQNERRARIVLTNFSQVLPYNMDGAAGYRNGILQAACLGPTYHAAHDLAETVVSCLNAVDVNVPGPSGVDLHYVDPSDVEDIEMAPFAGQGLPTFGKLVPIDWQYTT